MANRRLVWITLTVLTAILLPGTTVAAASEQPDDGVVIWNEDYTLAEGEELMGDLVIFNGDVTLESESRVTGDIVVWNGSASVDGLVEGALVASNGDIVLGQNAKVQGDVVCTWNCDIDRQEGAQVLGELVEGPAIRGIPFGELGAHGPQIRLPSFEPERFWLSGPEQLLKSVFRIFRRLVTVLVIAAVGGVVALIWPKATERVGNAIFDSPGASIGVGVLTLIAATALVVALAITICLSPAAALVALTLSAAGLFGWIAVGTRIGGRLLQALNAGEVPPLWAASLGTLVVTLISVGLSTAFCLSPLGWLLTAVIGCFGLGAVMLTRFGTTRYVPGTSLTKSSAPVSAAAAEGSNEKASTEERTDQSDAVNQDE